MSPQAATQRGPVTLISHPLQRVGAFALMALAGVDDRDRDPESLTPAEFEAAVAVMRADVAACTLCRTLPHRPHRLHSPQLG